MRREAIAEEGQWQASTGAESSTNPTTCLLLHYLRHLQKESPATPEGLGSESPKYYYKHLVHLSLYQYFVHLFPEGLPKDSF